MARESKAMDEKARQLARLLNYRLSLTRPCRPVTKKIMACKVSLIFSITSAPAVS